MVTQIGGDSAPVVVMAAATRPAQAESQPRFWARVGRAASMASSLMRRPMTPVDMMRTSSAEHFRSSARCCCDCCASCMPRSPVAALAWPAFTSTYTAPTAGWVSFVCLQCLHEGTADAEFPKETSTRCLCGAATRPTAMCSWGGTSCPAPFMSRHSA